ncbi:MAG TPA: protein phosphatase CheZ [Paucimonas sp.]|nr:protein phosphatase CheZ [Paucimonas sp.]
MNRQVPEQPENQAQQPSAGGERGMHDDMLIRVGQMTRNLHESLRGLGFDKLLARAAHDIPDARDRLDYVAKMTEQAAQRVLNATDAAGPLQGQIEAGAKDIGAAWKAAMDAPFSEERYRALAMRTVQYLEATSAASSATKQHLMDIMMAQDFQDLTGQVITRVTDIAHSIEQQLLQLLIDYSPADIRRETGNSLMNGPQINPNASPDVVANQSQVDDLLDSLGF